MIDLSLLEDFVTGAGESLDEMESALLELDLSANNSELLDTIFRAMHTIKGAAQFVGLDKVASLSHVVEDLLDLLREGKKQVTPEIVDVLIQTKDRISSLVVDLEKTQTEITEVNDLIQQINVFLGVETSETDSQNEINPEEEEPDSEDDSEILAAFLSNDEDNATENDAFSDFLDSEPENDSPLLVSNTDANDIQENPISDGDDFNLFLSNNDDDDADDLSIFLSEAVNPNDLSVSKSEITSDRLEPEINTETAVIDNFEIPNEEHDKELFEIYIQQLQEKFHLLHEYNAHLQVSQSQEYLLIQILEIIESLKFAANYMAYNQLTTLYERWLTQILNAQNKLSRSEKTSLVFMDLYLQELQQFFPQLSATQTENPAIEPDTSTTELNAPELPIEPSIVEIPSEENLIEPEVLSFPDEVVVAEIPPTHQENTSKSTNDDDLFNKLDAALNISSIEESITSEPINEVFSSLLAATEEQRTKDQPSDLKPEIKTLAEINQAHTEAGKTSIVPDSITSKVIPVKKPVTKLKESPQTKAIEPKPTQKPPETLNTNTDNKDNSDKISPPVEIKKKPAKVFKKSIRVDADKIDSLMNQVGELIVDRAYLFQLANEINQLQNNLKESTGLGQKDLKPVRTFAYRFNEAIISLGRTSNELQEGVMKIRMLPIGQLFNRYPRLVHDVSQTSKKKVQLEIRGEDTELDKMIIEEISDPLIHIIRNAVDHGIETPAERLKQGKPETGHLILEAYHESNHILIEIIDDGKGIDTQRIKEKAEKINLFSKEELNRMSEDELTRFIMMPGFSTAKQISNTSGRGVGMDVVKKNIEKLNGSIEIESKPGLGTKMRLRIPLTLAIIHALLVRVGQDYFTIPLTNVEETLSVSEADISVMEETEVMYLRGKTLPIFRLSELFNLQSELILRKDFFIVVVNTNSQRIGLMVDALIGQEEVVIKPLADYLHEGNCFSGATIIGDGRISLILDIYELINMTTKKQIKKHHAHEQKSFSLLDNES